MIYLLSETISQLDAVDEKLLLLLNGAHAPFLDSFMWSVSDKWIWLPLYALLAYFIVHRYSWRHGLLCLLMIALTIAAVDQSCASLLRPALERLRPSNPDNPVSAFIHIVNDYRGGRFGFPSCHAANSFALATFVSLCYRRRGITILMMLWAAVIAYSRIYLGVHYPGDILVGMLIGCLYASLFYSIYRYISVSQHHEPLYYPPFSDVGKRRLRFYTHS